MLLLMMMMMMILLIVFYRQRCDVSDHLWGSARRQQGIAGYAIDCIIYDSCCLLMIDGY